MNRLQSDVDSYLRLELMGHMLTDHRWDGFEHDHSFEELLYVLKGSVSFCTDRQTSAVKQGEMLIVPRDLSHRVTAAVPSSFLYIGFQTNLVDLSRHTLQVLPQDYTGDLTVLAMRLKDMADEAFTKGTPFGEFSSQLLTFLIPALCSLETGSAEQDPKVILSNKVKQYIKHHYQRPIRVDEIAASLYHSPHYLGNIFASVNGMTIKEYTLQYKMQKAIWLLQNSESTVGDIAAMLGYESAHYFSKCFKAYFGFSPSTLRK